MTRPKTPNPLRTAILSLAILTILPLAPQTQATNDPTNATFTGHDCFESHAYFAADPDDFDNMPEGFSLVRDATGQGTIAAITRACESDAGPFVSTLAVVIVHAPEHLARPGADHAILLTPSMAAPGPFLDALHAWGVTDVAARTMSHEAHVVPGAVNLAESRTRGEPDFLVTVHAAGTPDALGLATLRTLQMDIQAGTITAAFDTERQQVEAITGPATAHFVWQGPGDLPDHRPGTGAIMTSPPVEIVFRAAPLDP